MQSSAAVLKDWIRALEATKRLGEMPEPTLAAAMLDVAAARGDAPALSGPGETLSYAALAARCNQYARWALAEGIAPGEVVGLLMPNRPEYLALWLGLTRIGCVVALLNTHIKPEALAHCIRVADARRVVVDAALLASARPAIPLVPAETRWWMHGDDSGALPRIDRALEAHPGTPLDTAELRAADRRLPAMRDRALLIYTSGTTGLPKAANVTHARILEWSYWFAGMMNAQPEDRLFDCLPMYHSVGGIVGVGAMLVTGGSAVLRERFSASRFWDDVCDEGCTIVQYIGELCRYLLQSPPHPRETAHAVRLFCGNGLRGDVWEGFAARFRIPRILEFYAATEGVVSLYNCEGKPGAIGRVPPFLAHRFPIVLVRCDPESGEPLRDADGRCVRCDPDEPGEAIGLLKAADDSPSRRFDGYTDGRASDSKILSDVFAPGDCWYRTGDLMRKDAAGYFYFMDRLGDTFRWRGENVATIEVASTLSTCPGVLDAVVYGVAVPGEEGKAGMAALAVDDTFSLPAFRAYAAERLPAYARPLFVRLCGEIEKTGTFKLSKAMLAREGFAASTDDPVWFDDRAQDRFVPCDAALLARLQQGGLRL